MNPEPSGVFVATLEDRSARRLAVLAFARAGDEAEAQARAAAELSGFGWLDVRALRASEVTDAGALPEDFRAAYETALAYGCALIIYDEP